MKIVVIEKCGDCPGCVHKSEDCFYQECNETGKGIEDENKIPYWCPLADYNK